MVLSNFLNSLILLLTQYKGIKMKSLITALSIALALSISAKAVSFKQNPFEIHEVNILEKELTPNILK